MSDSAPLAILTLTAAGSFGLNKQDESSPLDHRWATKAYNCVFSDSGALTARKGWQLVNEDSETLPEEPIEQLFEYVPLTGSNVMISALDDKLYSGLTTLDDITGAVSVTANNWQFVNFNGSVYGLQAGHALIKWSGTGDFAAVSAGSGTVPNGNCLLSAFGRLWGTTSDGQTLKSSTLLGDSAWTGVGTGQFTFTNVWSGHDRITALAAFNSFLVVFGERNIILLADGSGSVLGMDPANAYVIDVVSGVGCIARDSVQNINGDDLVFLSHNGVMSLRRIIEAKGNPLRDISKNIRNYLTGYVRASDLTQVRSAFVPSLGMYLLLMPAYGRTFMFDTKAPLQDGTLKSTEWRGLKPSTFAVLEDGVTLYCTGNASIYEYAGEDDNGVPYTWDFESGWIQLDPEISNRVKVLKRIGALVEVVSAGVITLKWSFDFRRSFTSVQQAIPSPGTGGEWGVGEFGTSEFGPVVGIVEVEAPASGQGQFVKVGASYQVTGSSFILNYMQLFSKVGRPT